MITDSLTAVACPPWCVVEHDEPGAFHAGPDLLPNGPAVRLFQADTPGAQPGVVVAGHWLNHAQAYDLGAELLDAAEVVRQARRSA